MQFLSRSPQLLQVSSLVAWDADVDVALTAPFARVSAEHVLARQGGGRGPVVPWGVENAGKSHGKSVEVMGGPMVIHDE